jgi:flagellar hook-associated protein 3 FlgL
MRIASSTVFTNAVTAMNQQETIIAQDQQQVSTGRRINSPEDDPFASATSVTLNQQISRLSDFNQNRSLLSSNMTQMGSVLTSVTAALQSVS